MKEPIRVLHVCQRMEAAGIQSFLMNMYRNIDRTKVQFDFLVHYKEEQFYDDEIEEMGGHIYKFSVREDYNIFKYIKELRVFFEEHTEYQIIHAHMDTLGAFYLKSAKRANIKVRIAHAHSASVQNGIKKAPRLFMISRYKKYANQLFACSEKAGEFMFPNEQYHIINNAIDTKKFKYNQDIREKKREELCVNEKFVIGHVGRFCVEKNQIFLLQIMKEIIKIREDAILLLIGSGEDEKKINEFIDNNEMREYVKMLGNRGDINELCQAMDIFTLPSIYEGLPLAGIEAQASGLPCIFSDTITPKADVTGNVEFLSLEESTYNWAKCIINKFENHNRENVEELIQKAGYSAQVEAEKLQKKYLSLIEV